jgi:hypothetical protein
MVATIGTIRTIEERRAAPGLAVRVDLIEGEFAAPCEICGVRPTSIIVRVWDDDLEALQKLGETGPIERHPFCAEHQGAADALYHELTPS